MGYSIKITRDPWLTLDEWMSAVLSRSDVRLRDGPATARNPQTGEAISVGHRTGDADVLLGGEWAPCFWWRHGAPDEDSPSAALFTAPPDFDVPGCRVRQVARELAKSLQARLIGEEGEEYE